MFSFDLLFIPETGIAEASASARQ